MMWKITLILNWRTQEPPRDMVQLHTSATLFIGVFMLAFFAFAGIIPFVSFVVNMK
ncbi:MAG: hypothetical protein HY343_08585 [Lentisphaerae bacterium]|nr:hypothetical protein [Lentisphaerota bacterium]